MRYISLWLCVFEMRFHYITQTSLKLMAFLKQSSRAGFTGTHHHLTGFAVLFGMVLPKLRSLRFHGNAFTDNSQGAGSMAASFITVLLCLEDRGQSHSVEEVFLSGKDKQD